MRKIEKRGHLWRRIMVEGGINGERRERDGREKKGNNGGEVT